MQKVGDRVEIIGQDRRILNRGVVVAIGQRAVIVLPDGRGRARFSRKTGAIIVSGRGFRPRFPRIIPA